VYGNIDMTRGNIKMTLDRN